MAGPTALLLLGGLLGGLPQIGAGPGGTPGGSETPPELEEEASVVRRWDPQPPHCFTRTLHELSCFWDSPGEPDPHRYRLEFRLEQDPWQECPLSVTALSPRGGARFWCSFPDAATVTFVPLELRVLPGGTPGTPPKISDVTGSPPKISDVTESPPKSSDITKSPPGTPKDTGSPPGVTGVTGPPPKRAEPPPAPLFQRTIFIDQLVLPGPPRNVSVSAGGARGELCVRWAPPPGPYLHSSLVFELALSPPGGPPKTVGVPAGRREQRVGGLRGSTPYSVRARARPDGISYGGFWSPWSRPAAATTPPELDAVTLGLSCLLVLLLLGLGALGLLGHRRTLQAKLWPPVPGPEREFEGLFSNYGGNFQLWLCQGPGSPWAPPAPPPLESEDAVEEVGLVGPVGAGPGAPPAPEPPPPEGPEPPPQPRGPPGGPSPSPSFEYTLFDPGSALLCPPPRGHAPYANLGTPPKPAPPGWEGHAPHYVTCS